VKIVTDNPDAPEMARYLGALRAAGIPHQVVPYSSVPGTSGFGALEAGADSMWNLLPPADIGHISESNL
jgi:hypothetical protein